MKEDLKFIPIEDVPPAHKKSSYWDNFFESIPEKQATIVENITDSAVRLALKTRQKDGLFPNLKVHARQGTVYVVNYGQDSERTKK